MVFTHGGLTESVMHIMGDGSLTQDRIAWIPGDIRLEPGSGTAFFTGCAPYFDAIFSDLGVRSTEGAASAMRLLNLAAVPFDVLASERCCGHDLLLAGDAEGFLELGRRNAAEFKERGIRRIITSCPECYHTLKTDYPRYIGDWPCEVVHILELPAIYDIKQERNPVDGKKVTYHDPCSLGRRLKLYDSPRKLLAALPGAEVIEMDDNRENALCCGASPWAFCGAVNKQIQDERLKQAAATGADCLVTACPKCLIHLTCAGTSGDGKYNGIEITDLYSLLAPGPAAKETHL
jgi:Fe-S oxidoreductase